VPTTVTTQAGLIDAINAANRAGGAHTITLGANIALFETTPNNNHDGPNGLPEITNNDILTIAGAGLTIERSTSVNNADFRLFDVGSGATLILQNMVVKNGLAAGTAATIIHGGFTFQGGAIFVDDGGTLSLNHVDVTENAATCTVQAPSTGPGLQGNLEVQGGGIYNAGTASIQSSVITGNSANFKVVTLIGFGTGFGTDKTDNNDGDLAQNGFNGNVVVEGGGICNSGNLTVTSSSVSKNSATSTVINGGNPANGDGNGSFDGDNDSGTNDGNVNGNGVNGDITVEGGGVYNAGTTTLMGGSLTGNSAESNVTNGSHNGDNNGDKGNGGNGAFNGNGVVGNIIVAGGGIYSLGMLSATGTGLSGNFAESIVVNGSNNGQGNGDQTNGGGGNDNGNGVDGNIRVAGGAIARDDNLGIASLAILNQCNLSGNLVTSSITNGSSNGQGDGDSNVGTQGAENNGNGVTGSVDVVGGGIDDFGEVSMTSGSVSHNFATSFVMNGNNNGIACGNSDQSGTVLADDGDGLAGDLTVQGGGINNDHTGGMAITSATVSDNSVASSVTNGFDNGNACGNSTFGNNDGNAAGNGVTGNLLVGGGAVANNGTLGVSTCTLTANSVKSTISNGNNNGINDGQLDSDSENCGISCGDGVGDESGTVSGAMVEVAGGAIVNFGSTTLTSCSITGNSASSSITNSAGNGLGDGVKSTGMDGQGDGDGVNGSVAVLGGGTANLGTGSLTFASTTPTQNSVSSNPTSGTGNFVSDGVVVDGNLTATGPNTFNGNVGLAHPTGYQVASIALSPSGSAPSMMLDSRQPSLPMQGNQKTLMEVPAYAYETAGIAAHTAMPAALHASSHSMDADAFFLDPWNESVV
jgi:hypothetical protein